MATSGAAAVAVDCAAAVSEIKDMPGSKRYSFFFFTCAGLCLLAWLFALSLRLQANFGDRNNNNKSKSNNNNNNYSERVTERKVTMCVSACVRAESERKVK